MQKYLDPTNDVAFKRIFSNKERMIDFLNAILSKELGSKIVEVEFVKNEEVPQLGQGKRSILDLKVKDEKGNLYIVEMQNRFDSFFLNRVQYYAAHSVVNQLHSGNSCKDLMPIIVICVLNHEFFPEDVPCVSYHVTKETTTSETYLQLFSYVFIELKKFKKSDEEIEGIVDEWLHFLCKPSGEKEVPEYIKDLMIRDAYRELEIFNWTEEQYDSYVRADLLIQSENDMMAEKLLEGEAIGLEKGEAIGLEKGEAIGLEKGIKKQAIETARSMLRDGMSAEKVSVYTGLSLDEVRKIL